MRKFLFFAVLAVVAYGALFTRCETRAQEAPKASAKPIATPTPDPLDLGVSSPDSLVRRQKMLPFLAFYDQPNIVFANTKPFTQGAIPDDVPYVQSPYLQDLTLSKLGCGILFAVKANFWVHATPVIFTSRHIFRMQPSPMVIASNKPFRFSLASMSVA